MISKKILPKEVNVYLWIALVISITVSVFFLIMAILLVIEGIAYYKLDEFHFGTEEISYSIRHSLALGLCAGSGGWLMAYYQSKRYIKLGKEGLKRLVEHGYVAEIQSISSHLDASFYLINGIFYHSYIPIVDNLKIVLNQFEKIIIGAKAKNIVINLSDSNVDLEKFKKSILNKFNAQLEQVIIIDKSGNVIKLK